MRFTVTNHGSERADVELGGWLENAVLLHSGVAGVGTRHNSVEEGGRSLRIDYSAEETKSDKHREPIVFEDFQKDTYKGWTTTGTAFGKGPILRSQVPALSRRSWRAGRAGGELARLRAGQGRPRDATAKPARSPAANSRSSGISSPSGSAAGTSPARNA